MGHYGTLKYTDNKNTKSFVINLTLFNHIESFGFSVKLKVLKQILFPSSRNAVKLSEVKW
jgi:hypothetical protein